MKNIFNSIVISGAMLLTAACCTDNPSETLVNQFSSVAQLCPTLCDPMNQSTPGLPVHHQLPEFTETHVHRVSDAIPVLGVYNKYILE